MNEEGSRPGLVIRVLTSADQTQRSHCWLAFPHAVLKKFSEDRGSYLAAVIAFYGFFSLFPLLLVLVTVLGYVLAGNPGLQERILDSAITQFPVIGSQIRENVGSLHGSLPALVIGTVATLWAGLAALQAMEFAMGTVWGVPPAERPNFIVAKLRALVMLPVLGVGVIGVALLGAAGTVTNGLGVVGLAVGPSLGVLLAIGLFLVGFHTLTNCDLPWRAHLPGAVVGGVLFAVLHIVGGLYVDRVVRGAEETYGVFAVVIGLLSWMSLQAQFAVLAAEVNVVHHNHLWPRHLPGTSGDPEVEKPTPQGEAAEASVPPVLTNTAPSATESRPRETV